MKTVLLATAGLALAAGFASPAAAASSCADVAGRTYVYALKGNTKPGAVVQAHAAIGRIVLGAGGAGVANSFVNGPGAVAGFRDDKVACSDVPGQPPRLVFTGGGTSFELRFHTKGSAAELVLMRDNPLQATIGDAVADPSAATGGRYDACLAANGVFVGAAEGPYLGGTESATLARYTFVSGSGPVSYLAERADSVVALVNQRVVCKTANAAGAGRFIFSAGAGVAGSAIVYSTANRTRFAIIEEKVGSPALGWVYRQP
ncbi:hypothetical protein [Oharaeibacter diazotrophicus]|uniref:Uncharacterized protein n=1 Tax=Oharaeibacter diazotrophicus TaxID=1920512 RepID=A0A4R6R7Q7_9HYPH|nr:hypothetical protein [Oharaeibacter diazotrophicus]TDP81939.1 hypothetical protein EDD54_4200 [Oharaeibacter diazotrophicus]BBE73571.1 hypothetical protein OHA_1_03185 [Pleomorphomonas sp. SM30]GLS75361.1 hypothetical protein GCM10007904_06960 [Oharaeibacter diazotrophicus]